MTADEQNRVIINALRNPHRLSTWENDFIARLNRRPDALATTPKQFAVLQKMADKLARKEPRKPTMTKEYSCLL